MNIQTVKNPQWVNAEHTMIDVVVKFEHLAYEVLFTADQNDIAEHGRALFGAIQAGEYGEIATYIPPPEPEPLTPEQLATVEGAQIL